MSAILSAHDVVKSYGGRRVLDQVSLTAAPGHRIGLVGENGAGKSTLLRLLAGHTEPDRGAVTRPDDGEPGFLPQQPPYPGEATVGDVREDALADLRAVRRRLDRLAERLQRHPDDAATLAAYGEALQWATDHDLWDADRRAALVLHGLGLAGVAPTRPLATLSGGERSRLGLAALLIRRPRALLLDEPTNHLDDPAVEFLEQYLAGLPGAVVLASHDRLFLDRVCTGVLDLDPGPDGPRWYGGNYSDYLRAKRLERRRWQERYAAEQARLRSLREAVATTAREVSPGRERRDGNKLGYDRQGGRVQAQVSRRVRNARRRLDELDRHQLRRPPAPLRFRASLTRTATDGWAVSLTAVRVPGRLRIDRLDLPADGRLLVTGPNGAGKSTLLAVLAGRLVPAHGTVTRRRGLRIGLLEQEVTFTRPERTPRELYDGQVSSTAVPLAGLGLLAPRELDRPVGELSVGQRRRLALALLVADPPDLLLLDEPTNHISLPLAEELAAALAAAPGAVVVASHDRWLRRSWRDPWLTVTPDR